MRLVRWIRRALSMWSGTCWLAGASSHITTLDGAFMYMLHSPASSLAVDRSWTVHVSSVRGSGSRLASRRRQLHAKLAGQRRGFNQGQHEGARHQFMMNFVRSTVCTCVKTRRPVSPPPTPNTLSLGDFPWEACMAVG